MRVLAPVLLLLLAACAHPGRVPPGTPAGEVQRILGAPAFEFGTPEGGRKLAYPMGPLGTETYMVHLDRDGRVARVEQVLNDTQFLGIQPGVTTGQEVRYLIGPPYRVTRFDNLRQDAWDYRFRDSWGYQADFSVMVDDRGVVASKVIVRLELGRDSRP
jgi:hypothetical protein